MLKPYKGHEWGAKKLDKFFNWCIEYHIKELTLYCFSLENRNRPKIELDYLMNLFRKEFKIFHNDPRIEKYNVKVNFIGRLNIFPKDIQILMKKIMDKTKNNKNFIINFAMGYGGRAEVIDAVKKIAKQIKQGKLDINKINEKVFAKNLYIDSEPDLIIRTGGEKRTSNFLNYQAAYSELIFIDKLWPEFEKEDFISCLEDYSKRERRLGK